MNIDQLLTDYMTSQEAAKKLKITLRAVQTACQKGQLPGAVQVGRSWFIPKTSIAARIKAYGRGQIPQKKRENNAPKNNPE